MFGVSRRHIERMIAGQVLPPVIKQGRRSFLAESDLADYIERLKNSRRK